MTTKFIGGPWDGKEAEESATLDCSVRMFYGLQTMHFYERRKDGNFYHCEPPPRNEPKTEVDEIPHRR